MQSAAARDGGAGERNADRRDERRIERLLTPRQLAAARELVRRVRLRVPAVLFRALLFGSRARGQGRPDSDVDVLLVFRALPPDREPHATIAEALGDGVAAETGVPVQPWSVSLEDLACGCRTPMLVDALDDGVPLWPAGAPPLRIAYTPHDALFCARALLDRVEEGGWEVADRLGEGDARSAAERLRDDVVRMCTAALLLEGETRPRRAEAVRRFAERHGAPPEVAPVLAWAARSFGPAGKDAGPVPPPPGGFARAARAVDALRARVARGAERLAGRNPGGPPAYP